MAFSSRRIIECVPMIFAGNREAHIEWKTTLARHLAIDPYAIVIVGSACCGISLNPNKNFKPFDDSSDIDVAVISSHYFDTSWHWLRNLGAARHRLPPLAQTSVNEHVSRLIYWGTVATDKILQYLPFGRSWVVALNDMAGVAPTEGRDVKVRLYRDFEALRSYHLSNLRGLQRALVADANQRRANARVP
jgi:hypothetical protein